MHHRHPANTQPSALKKPPHTIQSMLRRILIIETLRTVARDDHAIDTLIIFQWPLAMLRFWQQARLLR